MEAVAPQVMEHNLQMKENVLDLKYLLERMYSGRLPENVKALVRRAQAFEAVERYKSSLQDVKYVLQMNAQTVGQANWALCNQMQHRLTRVVQQLKAGM